MRLGRSTKAGRLSPATLSLFAATHLGVAALNEGREIKPGDTSRTTRTTRRCTTLNEGREIKPGDTGLVAPPPD